MNQRKIKRERERERERESVCVCVRERENPNSILKNGSFLNLRNFKRIRLKHKFNPNFKFSIRLEKEKSHPRAKFLGPVH